MWCVYWCDDCIGWGYEKRADATMYAVKWIDTNKGKILACGEDESNFWWMVSGITDGLPWYECVSVRYNTKGVK